MQNRLVLYCTCHHMSCIDIFGFSHEITRQLDDLRSVIVDTILLIEGGDIAMGISQNAWTKIQTFK